MIASLDADSERNTSLPCAVWYVKLIREYDVHEIECDRG